LFWVGLWRKIDKNTVDKKKTRAADETATISNLSSHPSSFLFLKFNSSSVSTRWNLAQEILSLRISSKRRWAFWMSFRIENKILDFYNKYF
jgi:hypothetical protein